MWKQRRLTEEDDERAEFLKLLGSQRANGLILPIVSSLVSHSRVSDASGFEEIPDDDWDGDHLLNILEFEQLEAERLIDEAVQQHLEDEMGAQTERRKQWKRPRVLG